MNRKKLILCLWFILGLMLMASLVACASTPKVDWNLRVTGEVSSPLSLSFLDLLAMDQVELKDVFMEKTYGEDETRSFEGVALSELLSQAGASPDYVSITALAADGYAIEITRDEMEGGILALKDGGEWIIKKEPDSGPLRLVFPKTPANRWAYQLEEIQVNK